MMRVVCGVMCGMNADVRPCASMRDKTWTTLKTCVFLCKNNRYHPAIHSFNQRGYAQPWAARGNPFGVVVVISLTVFINTL